MEFHLPRPVKLASFAALACSLAAGPALAAGYDSGMFLLANVREGSQRDSYLANLVASARAVDSDANGIDAGDARRLDERDAERARVQRESRQREAAETMAHVDTNRDGGISLEELAAQIQAERSGRKRYETMFRASDRNGNGLLSGEELGLSQTDPEFRRVDTNRDGGITIDELAAASSARTAETQPVEPMFRARDKDGNGLITADELVRASGDADRDARAQRQRRDRFARLLAFDPDRDGRLTEAELADGFNRRFAAIDGNGDGAISAAEFAAARQTIADARTAAEAPVCAVPAPGAKSQAFAFAADRGEMLSPLAIGSQDETTSIVDVAIAPGDAPLYVMLSAREPVIWNLGGATGRIERVVVLAAMRDPAGHALAAVAGVARDKVAFAEPGCFPADGVGGTSDPGHRAGVLFAATTGVPAKAAAAIGGAGSVALPSLAVQTTPATAPAPAGYDPATWWEAIGAWPRGVGQPDPASLVSAAAIEPYPVLPNPMGLAWLVGQGVLAPTENLQEYRILKPLDRFPAGMTGGNRVSFVLPAGMPMPAGSSGDGCIYAPDGKIIRSAHFCHRSPRGDALTVRVGADGQACLYSYGGKKESCFPRDGGGLRVEQTAKGRKFKPVDEPPATAGAPAVALSPLAMPVDIIPAGLSQRW